MVQKTHSNFTDYQLHDDPRFVSVQALGLSLGLDYGEGGLMSSESGEFSQVSIVKLRSNVFPRVGARVDF